MNYGDLKARILAILGRAPDNLCYQLVTGEINRELRLQVMQTETTRTESAEISLPDDFLEVIEIYRDTDPRTVLRPTSLQALQAGFQPSGTPSTYAIMDGSMYLSPAPDGSETIRLRYIAEVADFEDDDDENEVLTKYPDIYVYGVLSQHAHLIGDDRAAIWGPLYTQAKQSATTNDARQQFANGPLKVRPAYATP